MHYELVETYVIAETYFIVGELRSEGRIASISFHERLWRQLLDAICQADYSLTAGTDQSTFSQLKPQTVAVWIS